MVAPLATLAATLSLPAAWCQAYFVLASCGVLAVAAAGPDVGRHLLDYGARGSREEAKGEKKLVALAALASWGQVPHSWFAVFYATSFALSLFWAAQYASRGAVFYLVASKQAQASSPSMTADQAATVWCLMLLQSGRRIYEHMSFIKSSQSKMWIVHWLLGVSFYVVLSVSIWVEGSASLLARPSLSLPTSPRLVVAAAVFFFAWANQYRCHRHLAGLPKYSLPQGGLFRFLVCPHYACECLLYASLAVAAAPPGCWYNRTLLCALVFVTVNLGTTAAGTKRWYAGKFGPESVAGRWAMIPFVF